MNWFTPTTTDPVVLKVDVALQNNNPATVDFDYAGLYRSTTFGVDISYKTTTLKNGSITQGQARSAVSPAVYAYGANFTLDGITATSSQT